MSDPREVVLVEKVAFGILFERDGGEAGRQSAIFVRRYVRNDRDSRSHFINVVVGERYAHGASTDVARCTARWRACR